MTNFETFINNLPYNFRFARYDGAEGGFQVELYAKDNDTIFGSGVADSFLAAYQMAHQAIEMKINTPYKAIKEEI